jgi:hypothetical protein
MNKSRKLSPMELLCLFGTGLEKCDHKFLGK